jgi:hypothetical protein
MDGIVKDGCFTSVYVVETGMERHSRIAIRINYLGIDRSRQRP